MRRIIAPALIASLLSFSAVGLVGCGEESKVEEKTKVTTPNGTDTKTTTVKDEKTGDQKTGAGTGTTAP